MSGSTGRQDHQTPETVLELLEKIGICFLFAQNYHIAMKYVAPIRKELGIRTVLIFWDHDPTRQAQTWS